MGECSRFFASENPVNPPAKNPAYIKGNKSSLQKKEESSSLSFAYARKETLSDRVNDKLQEIQDSVLAQRYRESEI